jgi:MFS family permease
MTWGMGAACSAYLAIPLAGGGRTAVIATLVATYCVFGAGLAVFNVHSLTVRQQLVPPELMGRVVSVYRLASWVMIPVGSLVGGFLGAQFGTRTALLVAAVGLSLSAVVFAWSQGTPTRRLRRAPARHRERRHNRTGRRGDAGPAVRRSRAHGASLRGGRAPYGPAAARHRVRVPR